MPKYVVRIESAFVYICDPSAESEFIKKFNKNKNLNILNITNIQDKSDPRANRIGFEISENNIKSGTIDISRIGNNVNISIDGEFILDVKSQYIDVVKDSSSTWLFNGFDGIYGDYIVDGLEIIDFSYFNNRLQKEIFMKFYCLNVASS